MTEKKLENAIRLAVSKKGHRFWRCNAGMGWAGKLAGRGVTGKNKSVTILNPRPFRGHDEGTPDLNGFVAVKITPEMVGHTLPIFASLELKTKTGRLRETQKRALAFLKKSKAVAGVARKLSDFDEILAEWGNQFDESRVGEKDQGGTS